MKEGREASGCHGGDGLRKGFARAASTARTVERGKNPEDGTGEGLATLVLGNGAQRPVAATRAPDVHVLEGARNQERRSRQTGTHELRKRRVR